MASSSPSMGGSLALAAATAMALSGSLVVFSLCRAAKPHGASSSPPLPSSSSSEPALRPCLSSSEKRGKPQRKAEKRVRFAEDVVDNEGIARPLPPAATCRGAAEAHRMPANREALYRGMLRDRSMYRVAYS